MTEETSFVNMDSWRGNSANKFGLTFEQIVIQHINRCVVNGSVEWHGGYWNETGNNPVTRTYVHNSREVYCNSVKMLRAVLLGYYDEKITEANKKLQEEFDTKLKEFEDAESKNKDVKYEWYNYKVSWHIRLFEELIQLSKRLNFFEEESSEGEEV